jgi:hypothetical protein
MMCQSWIKSIILENVSPFHKIITHHLGTNFGGKKEEGGNREKISILCSVMKGAQGRVASKVGSAPLFVGTWLQLGMAPLPQFVKIYSIYIYIPLQFVSM